MLIEIGTIINKYQNENTIISEKQVLLKPKEVLDRYHAITNYGLKEAVKNGSLPVIKMGKLNYFDVKDIEQYITSNKVKINKESQEKIKYV